LRSCRESGETQRASLDSELERGSPMTGFARKQSENSWRTSGVVAWIAQETVPQ
jgi:hypothetical protein